MVKTQFLSHVPCVVRKILLIAVIGCLAGAGCSLPRTQAANESDQLAQSEQPRQTVGWVEKGTIPGVDAEVDMKLDTGAKTTSINAEILEEPDEETESGGMIRFRFTDDEGNEEVFERPVVRWVRIKSRDGEDLRRPVVQMRFCVAGRWVEEEVNLADRDDFNYPVLIGRNMLGKANLAVDSAQTFTTDATCPEEEEQ